MKRYERNISLENFGTAGQEKLLSSKAAVIGAGGLGSAAIYYLAAAGVGEIHIIDNDKVEISNFNRQIIHATDCIGRDKVLSAKRTAASFNPECNLITEKTRITSDNIKPLIEKADVVLDCTDNFESRFIIADACWQEGKILCYASAQGYTGQLLVQNPAEDKPCYRCLMSDIPKEDDIRKPSETGVLGAIVGVMGSLQAGEAIKALTGIGKLADDEVLCYDGLRYRFVTMKREKNKSCPLCGG